MDAETPPPNENSRLDDICEEVAKLIGGKVTPDRVRAVIQTMNWGKHIVHGIKTEKDALLVMIEGIAPKIMRESYWTSGTRTFLNETEGHWTTYDTTFFHYALSYQERDDILTMTIAITNDDILQRNKKYDGRISGEDYLALPFPIPRDQITILRITVHKGKPTNDIRFYAKAAEQKMFDLLETAVLEGYQAGGIQEVTIDLRESTQRTADKVTTQIQAAL